MPIQFRPAPVKEPFEVFYEANFNKTVHYINQKINNYHDAQDLASDIFLYCYNHYEEYDPSKSSLTTWLYMITNSRIKNFYRDHTEYADLDELSEFIPDDSGDLDSGVYVEQVHAAIMQALQVLPERQRQIVYLRFFKEYTNPQIADALGMTQVNVRVQLSRALDTLEKKCGGILKGE